MAWAFSSCNHGCFDSSTKPTVMACFVAFEEIEKICWDWSSFSVDVCKKQKKLWNFDEDFTPSLLLLCHGDQPKGERRLQMINQKKLLKNGLNSICMFKQHEKIPMYAWFWWSPPSSNCILLSSCCLIYLYFFFAFDVKPIGAFQCM